MDPIEHLQTLDLAATVIFIGVVIALAVMIVSLAARVDDLEDRLGINEAGDKTLAKEVRQADALTFHTTKMPRGSGLPPRPTKEFGDIA